MISALICYDLQLMWVKYSHCPLAEVSSFLISYILFQFDLPALAHQRIISSVVLTFPEQVRFVNYLQCIIMYHLYIP